MGGHTVKRLTFALVALAVLSATTLVVSAQQPTPPAATTTSDAAPAGAPAAAPAAPAPPSKIDKGDTAWMLTSSVLVLMMTAPGLALFYGGMVRQKNALGTLMHSFIIAALISVQWASPSAPTGAGSSGASSGSA
jgi:ammonium transporter, Amt family